MSFKALEKLYKGDSFKHIFLYWLPELITAIVFVVLPPVYDSYLTAQLKSIATYGAIGMASNFLHTLIKLSEALPTAMIAIYGRYNGRKEYEQCGQGLGDTFWTTCILGFSQFIIILFGANLIFRALGVPTEMVSIGASFLRIKSLGFFFMFTLMAFIGFMRTVKNTRMPMFLTSFGVGFYLLIAPLFAFGGLGIHGMGQNGIALATVIEFAVMNAIAIGYIMFNPEYKKYFPKTFFYIFSFDRVKHLLNISWPIIIDKSLISWSYVWLSSLIAPMGAVAIGSFDIVKNLERFAFIPAIAAGQIVSFLVSNRLGTQDPDGASANIKKVLILTALTVIPSLIGLCIFSHYFIGFFDTTHELSAFASKVLPYISLLVIFDFTQIVLSGALRGAGDVKTVMLGRFLACIVFFFPVSYFLSHFPNVSNTVRFTLTYGAFYLATGVMGLIFLLRMRNHAWQQRNV